MKTTEELKAQNDQLKLRRQKNKDKIRLYQLLLWIKTNKKIKDLTKEIHGIIR
jgi:hypothetical protein